jgi:hypothetical protein
MGVLCGNFRKIFVLSLGFLFLTHCQFAYIH